MKKGSRTVMHSGGNLASHPMSTDFKLPLILALLALVLAIGFWIWPAYSTTKSNKMGADFRGKWKLVDNENVVEFLTAMGRVFYYWKFVIENGAQYTIC